MVKIRLRRVGATKRPSYRIVAADSRSPRDGRFLEILGHYNPLTEPATVVVKEDRVRYWIEHGAQPTEVVVRLLIQAKDTRVATGVAQPEAPAAPASTAEAETETAQPRRTVRRRTTAKEAEAQPGAPAAPASTAEAETETAQPRRTVRKRTTAKESAGEVEQPESQADTGEERAQEDSGNGP